ncbi:MAG: ThuA domain-containing protein [Candidatus Omnitrophota bacterium]
MRKTTYLLTALVALSIGSAAYAADAPAKIQALMITGDDVAPAHNWAENSQASREILANSGKFDVRVCEDPMILESAKALEKYAVVILVMYNAKLPTLSDQAKENLLNFVKSGKGFVTTHLSSASFKEWDEFGNLCGRKWVMGRSGHGPRAQFVANIVKDHPITKGLQDFRIFDELYAKLEGDAPIEILVSADSDWSKKTEPLVFVCDYGQGRVFHDAFGHDRLAVMDPNHITLFARGCEWAATGKVTE